MQKNIFFAFFLLILSSFFWSGNFFTGKLAFNNELSPFKLSFFRWLLALIVLMPFTIKDIIRDFNIYIKDIKLMFFIAIFGVTIFNSFTYISLKTTLGLFIRKSFMTSI